MNWKYERLVFLAEEQNIPSESSKILELNELLSALDPDDIKDNDLRLLDDLICILSNTENILAEKHDTIMNLLEGIRLRRSK